MRTGAIVAIVALLGVSGAAAMACSGSTEENPGTVCDPATDPACAADGGSETAPADGGDDATVTDTSLSDGAIPDGLFVPPDGSIILPDGAVLLPDGAILTDAAYPCVPGGTQCTNCLDDDGDGLVDWLDPECTGPLDRDEGSFATGIPGDNIDPCKQDCWFDGNSGAGDDGCDFDAKCLVGSKDPKCPYDPKAAADPKQCPPPSEKCKTYCKPLTPKGCDCAGCCDVYDSAGKVYTVKLVAGCTSEALGDATKCPTCTKIADCSNPCGKCDWCLGKTSLPPECYPPPADAGVPDGSPPPDGMPPSDTGVPASMCPSGLTACSPTIACPIGQYCLTGCCIKPPS